MQTICSILLLLIVNAAFGESDFEALLELKKGIEKGPSVQVLDSWDAKSLASDGCPKNWRGITCTEGHVTSITLHDMGLVGSFSFSAITSLKMLRNLSISNNHLTGTISKIGSLEPLEFLDLSCNMFHGLIPSGMVNLRNIVLLNLSSNNFDGSFPSGFGNLEQLKYLDLRANSFSGDIMHLLSQLGGVVHVDLSINQFSGSLDLGLANPSLVSSIKYLNISHNSLIGELFPHDGMPFFDSLEVLDGSNNQLVGTIPSLSFVVSLRILRLGSNQLSGSLPEALLQESSMLLSELDLSFNQLEGPIGSITSATLRTVNISSNKLSGSLPIQVGHCAVIDLSNNMLLGNLSRMKSWGNYVEVINLSSNSLTGTLPNQTSQFLRLTSFEVSNNSLEGTLPTVLGTYPELKVIDLSHNHLDGFLLPSFFTSTKMTDINLSHNNFTGLIPLQDIQNNPSIESTQNSSLVSLDLSYNSFIGQLPLEISKLYNLEDLDLSNNKFEGRVPDDLPDRLKKLNLSFNNLSGVVPDNLRRFPDSAFHPGNSLLIFPYPPLSPKDAPDLTLRERGSHMSRPNRIALLAGIVGAAVLVAVLFMVICFRSHWYESRRSSSKGRESSVSQKATFNNNVEQSLPSSHLGSVYDSGDTSSVLKISKEGFPDTNTKDEGLSPPTALDNQVLHEHHCVLNVHSPDKLAGDLHLFDGSLVFTAEELSHAPAEVIGRSCHGALYKATLDLGNILAVKWLREEIAKGQKEFSREVKKLGNIKHPNLVSLQGYYCGPKEHEKLLISKYFEAPSLAVYLQETQLGKCPPLSLEERLKTALEVAQCLNYLHNERAIPHGNLKSTNILLEAPNNKPLVTDYSLHRILTPTGTAEQVLNAGALGYRPPEFASSSRPCPSLKSDVYAFGVILLELLTGKISGEIVSGEPGGVDLTDWVRSLARQNRSVECFDRLILNRPIVENPPKALEDMLQVALSCILPAPERPDMTSVFDDLSAIALTSELH